MTTLKRWLDDTPSEEIRHLLAVARDEKAPPRLLDRTLVALGTTSATAAAATSGAAVSGASVAKLSMLGVVLKWGGAGLVSGTLVAGAVAGVTRVATRGSTRSQPDSALHEPAPRTTNPSPELPRQAATASDVATRKSAPNSASMTYALASPNLTAPSAVTTTNGTGARPAATNPAPNAARPAPANPTLMRLESGAATAREVALVDAARNALRAGDGAGSLQLLGDYERRFSPAHLEPEVLYLRMQAAEIQADDTVARRAARQIVREYPQSPEAGRAEELLHAGGTSKE
jgi:hypothetical protein